MLHCAFLYASNHHRHRNLLYQCVYVRVYVCVCANILNCRVKWSKCMFRSDFSLVYKQIHAMVVYTATPCGRTTVLPPGATAWACIIFSLTLSFTCLDFLTHVVKFSLADKMYCNSEIGYKTSFFSLFCFSTSVSINLSPPLNWLIIHFWARVRHSGKFRDKER